MAAPLSARSHFHPGMGSNGSSFASALARQAQSFAGSAVRRVVLRSNLSPDIELDPLEAAGPSGAIPGLPGAQPTTRMVQVPGAPPGTMAPVSTGSGGVAPGQGMRRRGGFSEFILALAKPEIEIDTIAGRIRVAPWGPPTTNLFWPAVILGTAGITALGILAVRGLTNR